MSTPTFLLCILVLLLVHQVVELFIKLKHERSQREDFEHRLKVCRSALSIANKMNEELADEIAHLTSGRRSKAPTVFELSSSIGVKPAVIPHTNSGHAAESAPNV